MEWGIKMHIDEILNKAVNSNTSDIFIVAGTAISFKINGIIEKIDDNILKPQDTRNLIEEIYELNVNRKNKQLIEIGEDDFSFSLAGIARFRCNVFYQRGSLSAVLRIVRYELPDYKELKIPEKVISFSNLKKGLVLVTGSAGSGKSTSLACIINEINNNYNKHIITIEDPIEYLHRHKKSIVSQREIEHDTLSYSKALRAALREVPDVILLGEMRDLETIQIAMSAAETGHLVLSTLHTLGAADSINRIIDVFPANQQEQIRVQLSMTLQAIVSQQLIPGIDNNMHPAFEIMVVNNAIRTQIRDGKTHLIDNYIRNSKNQGMITMDDSIYDLYTKKLISEDNAINYATNDETMRNRIGK